MSAHLRPRGKLTGGSSTQSASPSEDFLNTASQPLFSKSRWGFFLVCVIYMFTGGTLFKPESESVHIASHKHTLTSSIVTHLKFMEITI